MKKEATASVYFTARRVLALVKSEGRAIEAFHPEDDTGVRFVDELDELHDILSDEVKKLLDQITDIYESE